MVDNKNLVSIVTPSFEKHVSQYEMMLKSIIDTCEDLENLFPIVIIEKKNESIFKSIFKSSPLRNYKIIFTEDVLASFGIYETPSQFLKRVGKFTFQTIKKFGGLRAAETEWSLVLDSEGIFMKKFKIQELVNDYASQKYVFYTNTTPRGELWTHSVGYQINKNVGETLYVDASKRWYMESFHWFYETDKVKDLIENHLGALFLNTIRTPDNFDKDVEHVSNQEIEFFENILYYNYLEKYYPHEYNFIDFEKTLKELVPDEISGRFILKQLPFSLFGNDYLLNIVAPNEVHTLSKFFKKYKLPFIRLEPPFFDHTYFEELKKLPYFVATISSHHHIWLNKKIAVCVSGEFRHIVHRTPEQQVRNLKSFVSGVDCDFYIHGWRNSSEALIIHELQPKAYLFEEQKSFHDLEKQIQFREPRLKPNRDLGSLSMFYGIQKCHELVEPNLDDYDYIIRIRPDMFGDRSLKEILVSISDQGDFSPNAIYFPKNYHSKGINDQFAIGSPSQMRIYAHTYDYIVKNISNLFFNPESILLKNILDNNIPIFLVNFPYALMREVPMYINDVHRIIHQQEHVWWSKTDHIPAYTDVTEFFRDKLSAMETLMKHNLPKALFVPVNPCKTKYKNKELVLELLNVDNNPSRVASLFIRGEKVTVASHFSIEDGKVKIIPYTDRYFFCFHNKEELIVSQWSYEKGKFKNERLFYPWKSIKSFPKLSSAETASGWKIHDRIHNLTHVRGVDRVYEALQESNLHAKNWKMKLILFVMQCVMNKRKAKKLRENPNAFFADANGLLSQIIGRNYLKNSQ